MIVTCGGSLTHAGHRVTSFQQWSEQRLPPPTIEQLQLYLELLVRWSQSRSGGTPMQQVTLRNRFASWCATWRLLGHCPIPRPLRVKGLAWVEHLARKHQLVNRPKLRAQLGREAIAAMLRCCFSIDVSWSFLERLQVAAFIAMSCQTGLRPNPIIGATKVVKKDAEAQANVHNDLRSGSQFGDFHIFAQRSPVEGEPNQLLGYYQPRWNKTAMGRSKGWPLVPGPHIASSSLTLLLLILTARGCIDISTMAAVFDPEFCMDGKPTALSVPDAW